MVECRDWLDTLWAASFKGVPFYFESDKEKGGRDNVKHVFPHRDDPFVEDMGEAVRYFSGSAYVHGDNADQLATALKAALVSRGPGTLVVPYFGPVTVHCDEFERATQRDQMGYVAFEIKFVRGGAATALISVPFLQNQAFIAIEAMATAVASAIAPTISVRGEPDFVVGAATDTLQAALATVDVMRRTYPTDPIVSATLRDLVAARIAAVPAQVAAPAALIAGALVPSGAGAMPAIAGLIEVVRTFGDALPAIASRRAAIEYVAAFAPSVVASSVASPLTARADVNRAASARAARLAGLMMYAEGVLRSTYTSRPDGVTARGEVAERFESELLDTTGADNAALYLAIDDVRNRVIVWLTQTVNTLAPVIMVETARIRPSLDLAWTLYADPMRADELVARNKVRHPSFMPRDFSALSR